MTITEERFTDKARAKKAVFDKEQFKAKKRIEREALRELDAEDRGQITIPVVQTLRDLLAEPDDETPWRIADCQPSQSRVILAAQFKAGKTTLVGNVIRSLRDGDPFLGKYPVTPVEGTIALLDFEMGRNQLKRWYRDQQIQADDRVIVLPLRGRAASFNLTDTQVRAAWVNLLRDHHVTYLIVDCLRPILDALGLDEHSEVGTFLEPFDALLAEAGIPDAIIVHHMGHANERSRGDSRLRDWPDVEWQLTRLKSEDKDTPDDPAAPRFFKAYGRDVDITEQELGYDEATRCVTVVGGSRRDKKIEGALPAVLAFITGEKEPPSQREILKGLKGGHAQQALRDAIKLGIKQGKIHTKPGTKGATLHSIVTEASTQWAEM